MIRSAQIAAKYFKKASTYKISALGNGLINDTFLVNADKESFVLQRINPQVFPMPNQVMENMMLLNQHLSQQNMSEVKLNIPRLIKTIDNDSYAIDPQKNVWRALEFIDNTVSKETINHLDEAKQLGFALGHFHRLFKNVPLDDFHDTLPGFHITPQYFQDYQSVEDMLGSHFESSKISICRKFIDQFKTKINVIETARLNGFLNERITHGDPKLNNFLFEKGTNRVISIIDLDTVKPGIIHHDIADCLRSCCHISHSNNFDIEIFSALLDSYLQETHTFLSNWDYHYLYPAIQLMPFELGLRFFTDYLQGNSYFKVNSPEQNLNKAIKQFQLCESIEKQKKEIKQKIESFRMAYR